MPKYRPKKLRPPIQTSGGKAGLCRWIIDHFPDEYEEMVYVEPFCAGGSVFLNKHASQQEVISDIDEGAIAIFKTLRDEPKEFISRIKRTRCTERAFKIALNKSEQDFVDYVDRAVNEYILRRMSRGGLKKTFASSEAWGTIIAQLPSISERIQDTVIICADFVEMIKNWDEENTLFYFDPTALHSTGPEGSTETEENEMSVEDHMNLLHLCQNVRGKVIISGRSSPLYNRNLKGWKCRKRNVANGSQTKSKDRRVECLWHNY